MFDFELPELIRATTEPIDRIINAVVRLANAIFMITTTDNGAVGNSHGYMNMLITTITSNHYLLIGVSLVFCGFVIGIISRMIHS